MWPVMEDKFKRFLFGRGISSKTLQCLEEEDILTRGNFCDLNEVEIMLLSYQGVTVGQLSVLRKTYHELKQGQDMVDAPSAAVASQKPKRRSQEAFQNPQTRQDSFLRTKQELFEKYREAMKEKKNSGASSSSSSESSTRKTKTYLGIHYGAMVYESTIQKGVKKQYLPPPRIVDIHKNASYEQVIQQGMDIFFKDDSKDLASYSLCGTSGAPFDIPDPEDWYLGEFMKKHGYQPSKFRLYILYNPPEMGLEVDNNDNDDSTDEDVENVRSPSILAPPYSPIVKEVTCAKCKDNFFPFDSEEISTSFKSDDGNTFYFGVCPDCH